MAHEAGRDRAPRRPLTGRTRRHALLAGVALAAFAALPVRAAPLADTLDLLWARAAAAGVARATFETAVAGLTLDPAIPDAGGRQAEFERPLGDYLEAAASPGRVATGRAEAARLSRDLAALAQRENVPPAVAVAAWGMESDYGRTAGTHDSLRALVTLAATRADPTPFLDEAVAALQMLERGVPRALMKGSWAGAMGDPQFMPSAYLADAVAFAGDGPPDIWTRKSDVLASIAHFFARRGWQPGLPWGVHVRVPAAFDYPTLDEDFAAWRRAGFLPVGDAEWPTAGRGSLFLPAGADGPAFLLTDNYWRLKAYNNSDSYALSLGVLADRIEGAPADLRWPKIVALPRRDRIAIQTALKGLSLYDGTIDGRFGPTSRTAIHRFQLSAGLAPADGFARPTLLAALRAARP